MVTIMLAIGGAYVGISVAVIVGLWRSYGRLGKD